MAVDERFAGVGKTIVVLDFRDHDPSGIQMTEDLQTRFTNYGEGLDIDVKRIALTIDQVEKYSLIPNPTKAADPRTPKYASAYGNNCWELDAIEPDELQRIVGGAINEHIDMSLWNEGLAREDEEREALQERFSQSRIEV
jgi:hypothetical protein